MPETTPDGHHVALGERGVPWWEQSDEEREARWSADVPTVDGVRPPR
ncbi:hypothetical protein [Aeromicrobium terrae]|nr:hypothetical protein [Aeromicrobium terrae]